LNFFTFKKRDVPIVRVTLEIPTIEPVYPIKILNTYFYRVNIRLEAWKSLRKVKFILFVFSVEIMNFLHWRKFKMINLS